MFRKKNLHSNYFSFKVLNLSIDIYIIFVLCLYAIECNGWVLAPLSTINLAPVEQRKNYQFLVKLNMFNVPFRIII